MGGGWKVHKSFHGGWSLAGASYGEVALGWFCVVQSVKVGEWAGGIVSGSVSGFVKHKWHSCGWFGGGWSKVSVGFVVGGQSWGGVVVSSTDTICGGSTTTGCACHQLQSFPQGTRAQGNQDSKPTILP